MYTSLYDVQVYTFHITHVMTVEFRFSINNDLSLSSSPLHFLSRRYDDDVTIML